jgi:DNA-binding LacI/PurR family transcriptional regulator
LNNIDIRREAEKARIRLFEIADRLGITDSTFSRKLRKELSAEEKQRIRAIIAELKNTGGEPNAAHENNQ